MKKLYALVLAAVIIFGLSSTTFAQPQIKVNVRGGYNLPMPDLKGDPNDSADNNTYFQKSGFSAGIDIKYYLGKKRNVGITLGGTYNGFTSGDWSPGNTTNITNKFEMNIIQVALGIEYAFMPKGKANPFIGLEFTGNFFSGKSTTTNPAQTSEFTLKSASRFGIAGGLGADFKFSKMIGAVLGVKYQMANLIGKDYDSTIAVNSTEFALNDKEYTVGTTTISAKNISWIQLYAGLTFYFNQPKTKVKK